MHTDWRGATPKREFVSWDMYCEQPLPAWLLQVHNPPEITSERGCEKYLRKTSKFKQKPAPPVQNACALQTEEGGEAPLQVTDWCCRPCPVRDKVFLQDWGVQGTSI